MAGHLADPLLDILGAQPLPALSSPIVTTTVPAIADVFHVAATYQPAGPSAAIVPALEGELFYPAGAANVTAGGHLIGALGRFQNNNTNTLSLGIGTEGRIDNNSSGTMSLATSLQANLINVGTVGAWYGTFNQLAFNSGPITTAAFVSGDINNSGAGSIGTLYGLLFPTLSSPTNITASYGFFYNPNVGIANRYAIFVNDAGAPIRTIGQIQTVTFQLDSGTKTATAVAGAATLNKASGKITSEALTTAAGAAYTLTLTNSAIAAADTVYASIANGTNTAGLPIIGPITPAAGSVAIVVNNIHASAALNGTLVISFASMKA